MWSASASALARLRPLEPNFEVAEGEALVLLGASGSGKTTILRIIAGLEQPYTGKVMLHGKDVTELPARERGVGVIFQSYALFPKMTVEKNIGYGLKIRHRKRKEIRETVNERSHWYSLKSTVTNIPHTFGSAAARGHRPHACYNPESAVRRAFRSARRETACICVVRFARCCQGNVPAIFILTSIGSPRAGRPYALIHLDTSNRLALLLGLQQPANDTSQLFWRGKSVAGVVKIETLKCVLR